MALRHSLGRKTFGLLRNFSGRACTQRDRSGRWGRGEGRGEGGDGRGGRGGKGRGSESNEGWRREKGVEGCVTRQASHDGAGIRTLYSVLCGRSSSRSEEERSSRLELEREDVLLEIRQLDRKEGREGKGREGRGGDGMRWEESRGVERESKGREGRGGRGGDGKEWEGRRAEGWRMV